MKTALVTLAIALLTTTAFAQTVRVCRDDRGEVKTFAKPLKDYAGQGWYPVPTAKVSFGPCRDKELCDFLSLLQTGCFERRFEDDTKLMTYLTEEDE